MQVARAVPPSAGVVVSSAVVIPRAQAQAGYPALRDAAHCVTVVSWSFATPVTRTVPQQSVVISTTEQSSDPLHAAIAGVTLPDFSKQLGPGAQRSTHAQVASLSCSHAASLGRPSGQTELGFGVSLQEDIVQAGKPWPEDEVLPGEAGSPDEDVEEGFPEPDELDSVAPPQAKMVAVVTITTTREEMRMVPSTEQNPYRALPNGSLHAWWVGPTGRRTHPMRVSSRHSCLGLAPTGTSPNQASCNRSEVIAGDVGPGAGRLELEVLLPVDACALLLAERLVGHREVEVRVGEAGIGFDRLLEVGDGA